MNEVAKGLLEQHGQWFQVEKRIWQPQELQIVYTIFNLATGENRRDTGCGSCRRAVIAKVRKMYQELDSK